MAENQNLIARLLVATGLVNEEQAGRAIAAAPDTEGGSSWPRNSASDWPGWRHGDIKDIAMPFVFDVFLDIC